MLHFPLLLHLVKIWKLLLHLITFSRGPLAKNPASSLPVIILNCCVKHSQQLRDILPEQLLIVSEAWNYLIQFPAMSQ